MSLKSAKALARKVGYSDPDQVRESLRLRCRSSLYFLAKAVLGYGDLTPTFHQQACRFVQNPELKRRLLELPRGHLKTSLLTRSKPIWRIIQEPKPPHFWGVNERMLLVMSGGEVASVQIQAIEHQFENNQLFRWLFPELIPEDFTQTIWNTQEMRVAGTGTSEPNVSVIGVGSKVTGRHFTGIIEDDLVDETICDSLLELERRVNWHQYAFPLLEVPERDWMDTVGNRWGRLDLNGWIRLHEPDCRIMSRSAILSDGKSLWPDRFPPEELARLRIKLGPYKFSCQYLNSAKDSESAAFNPAWLKYYELAKDETGADVLALDTGEIVPQNELRIYMVVDPAQTPGNRADRTGIVVTGIDTKGRIFILDAVAVRKDPHAALYDVVRVYERWRPAQLGVEAVVFSRLLIHPLERLGRERGHWLPVVPVKGANTAGAKDARINQVVGETFAGGRAWLRREMTDFADEYSWFPDPTTTRDLLDAYSLSDQLWTFSGKLAKPGSDEAGRWLRAARLAGMSPVTGY